jgi:hypothetical protein
VIDAISARPGINGNTARDFEDAYVALTGAAYALEHAMRELSQNVLNGRNYQHLADADTHLIRDRRAIHAAMREALALIQSTAGAVGDAATGFDD